MELRKSRDLSVVRRCPPPVWIIEVKCRRLCKDIRRSETSSEGWFEFPSILPVGRPSRLFHGQTDGRTSRGGEIVSRRVIKR